MENFVLPCMSIFGCQSVNIYIYIFNAICVFSRSIKSPYMGSVYIYSRRLRSKVISNQ